MGTFMGKNQKTLKRQLAEFYEGYNNVPKNGKDET